MLSEEASLMRLSLEGKAMFWVLRKSQLELTRSLDGRQKSRLSKPAEIFGNGSYFSHLTSLVNSVDTSNRVLNNPQRYRQMTIKKFPA